MTTRPDARVNRGRPARVAAALAVVASVLIAAMAMVFAIVMAASAHISVTPTTAETGSTAELTFRVPNEEAHAATTRVSLLIPTEHPIAQLLAKPIPGWKVTSLTTRLAKPLVTDDGTFQTVVSQVTWSGGRIEPGQYQDFSLSADPLPDVPTTLVFKALQGYSDGTVVRWIDVSQAGQPEPEHPAPTVTIVSSPSTAASPGSSDPSGSAGSMSGMGDGAGSTSSSGSGTTATAWVALGVSIVAILAAGAALVAARRRS